MIFGKILGCVGDSFFFPAETYDLLPTSPEYDFSVFFFPSGWKKKNSCRNDDQKLGLVAPKVSHFFSRDELGALGVTHPLKFGTVFPTKVQKQ